MKLIGSIFGEVKPTKFEIALSTTEVERGTYVKVYHEQYGWVLARIYDLRRFINQNSEEVMIASARPVGYPHEQQILMPRMPFKPDQKVYLADQEIIMQVIGIKSKKEGNLYLGTLEGHNLPVYLNLKKTIGKHVAVIAKTGAGKSYAVAVLIEELLKQKFPVVIIDPHGEYSSLKYENDDYDTMLKFNVSPHSYENQIQEYAPNIIVNADAKKLTLKPKFSLEELIRTMPMQLNDKQKGILYDALKRLEGRDYTLQDLINVVHLDSSSAKWKIINGLENLRNSGVFDGLPISNGELVQYGKASIINLKGCEQEIQELIVGKIARDLFNAKKLAELPDFFFLVEEAHNFCPEKGFGDALSSNILRTIASEGRKFGFYLGVVSQRPARIDKNVLSQCNTQIILKVTNPNDLKAIAQSIEGFTSGMENDIKDLAIGQALIVGECVEQPIVVNIRVRETKHIAKALTEEIKKEKQNSLVAKIKPIFLKDKVKESKKGIFRRIKNFFIEEV
ncbi:MAG: ATP-binding protein [Candidatus Altiarchaeota archaeon]